MRYGPAVRAGVGIGAGRDAVGIGAGRDAGRRRDGRVRWHRLDARRGNPRPLHRPRHLWRRPRDGGILPGKFGPALTVLGRDILIHLRQRLGCRFQALLRRARHQAIGARIVAPYPVAVEQHRTQHQLGARFTTGDRFFQPWHRIRLLARGEQRQAIIVDGLVMPLQRRLAEPALGERRIDRYAATELVGLAQIELRIGIARHRRPTPLIDRGLVVAALPGIEPRLDVLRRHGRRDQHGGSRHQSNQVTHPITSCPSVAPRRTMIMT